jgi:hypothetical protein
MIRVIALTAAVCPADATVTARTFSRLIKVGAVQSLVKDHLTQAEISAIEASANARISS